MSLHLKRRLLHTSPRLAQPVQRKMTFLCLPISTKKSRSSPSNSNAFHDVPDRSVRSPPPYTEKRPTSFRPMSTVTPKERMFQLGLPEEEAKGRLTRLRALLEDHKLDYYVVTSADEHQSEYTSAYDARRSYLTGFTGSAGTALISRLSPQSHLFVDNRYWVQAEEQTSEKVWKVVRVAPRGSPGVQGVWEWCKENLEDGARIGIDPKLIDWPTAKSVQQSLRPKNISLLGITTNLIDKLRSTDPHSQPPGPGDKLEDHPVQFSGKPTSTKLSELRATLFPPKRATAEGEGSDKSSEIGIYVLPVLPAIAWLLNLRCTGDIPHTPIFHSYLAITPGSCCLFIDPEKLTGQIREKLEQDGVEWRGYGVGEVKRWVLECRIKVREEEGEEALRRKGKVGVPSAVSWGLADSIGLEHIHIIDCPVDRAKGIKNPTELEGFRKAYLRDGAATVRWMSWLEEEIKVNRSRVGEYQAGEKLTSFRSLEQYYRGLAYDNISASGPNGALPHYMPIKGEDRIIDTETPYVIDAGGQYLDGTIDTTRTMHFGTPTEDQKRAFTRVLQGHIAIETTPFPQGTKGDKLDILARQYLFKDGLNFGHGVGHGIGSYLSVHEMPPGIGMVHTMEEGNLVSNEPGFYLEGHWGIRIESVIVCKKIETRYNFGAAPWLGWERITRVPIQMSLIDHSLLSPEETRWLRDHNALCVKEVLPLLNRTGDEKARKWLKAQV